MGLSIVQQLVEMLGGKVSAESEGVGLGSRFIVTLPRAQTGTGRSPQMGAAKLANVKGLRLMLIDDDPDTCDILARLLEESGAEVHSFMNVKSALLAFDEVHPDVVISDLGMPEQDGFELIRQLRARESGGDVPAVAVTAFARPEDKQAALKAGFDAHVPKPVDAEQLFSVIRAVSKLRT